jgi:hypothetical protein
MVIAELRVGDKVHYIPSHGKSENGIVKEIREGVTTACWVVYNCGGRWDYYMAYTSAKTMLSDLRKGWRNE